MNRVPMTKDGEMAIKEALSNLKFVERPKISEAIAEARAHGDLKENAEYHAAKELQGLMEAKINEMENAMMACLKDEEVREELLKDVEDFKKLVKKRGSFGACILPDAFGSIVKFMIHNFSHVDTFWGPTFCIFATEAYCYYIVYLSGVFSY